MSDLITSSANPAIVRVRSLLARRDRREQEHAFVAEGLRSIEDALAAGVRPLLLLMREGTPAPFGLPRDVAVRIVSQRVFDALSDVAAPQGILAVLPMPTVPERAGAMRLALVVDRVRDPGNLGALLRAAAGAGATSVHLSEETVDPFNPKVVRAGMGAHWRIPIRRLGSGDDSLRLLAPLVAVTSADADLAYDRVDFTGPAAIVIGSEAHGVSPELAAAATCRIAIPLAAGIESLNAATAGAVVLFEAARQRRQAG